MIVKEADVYVYSSNVMGRGPGSLDAVLGGKKAAKDSQTEAQSQSPFSATAILIRQSN